MKIGQEVIKGANEGEIGELIQNMPQIFKAVGGVNGMQSAINKAGGNGAQVGDISKLMAMFGGGKKGPSTSIATPKLVPKTPKGPTPKMAVPKATAPTPKATVPAPKMGGPIPKATIPIPKTAGPILKAVPKTTVPSRPNL